MSDDYNDENLLVDLVRDIIDVVKKGIENCTPCIVVSVESRTRVTVRPLITLIAQDGSSYKRSEIEGVPVYTAGAGDLLMSWPVAVGNKGWIEASDRDISLFLQSYEDSEPPTKRMHSFSDARFIPDIMTNFTIDGEDSAAVVIQNRDGSVKIALDGGEIRIKNNDASVVMGPDSIDVATSSVTIGITGSAVNGVAPGGFNLNGAIIASDGSITSPVSVGAPSMIAATSLTVAGKEQAGHEHLPGSYIDAEARPITGNSGVQT